jgi:hypothetical protein
MSVSLSKNLSIPASRSLGALVVLPSGQTVRVLAVQPLTARAATGPRVRLVGRTRHGGDLVVGMPAGAGLSPAQGI